MQSAEDELRLALLDTFQHGVEGAGQRGQLGRAADGDRRREVAARDPLRTGFELAERAEDGTEVATRPQRCSGDDGEHDAERQSADRSLQRVEVLVMSLDPLERDLVRRTESS